MKLNTLCCQGFGSQKEFPFHGVPWKEFGMITMKRRCIIRVCDTHIGCSQPPDHCTLNHRFSSWWSTRRRAGSHQHQVQSAESPTFLRNSFLVFRLMSCSLNWRYHVSSAGFSPFLTKSPWSAGRKSSADLRHQLEFTSVILYLFSGPPLYHGE